MKTICSCGFDCGPFIAAHAIPAGGRFDCPGCEQAVQAAEETLDVSRTNLEEPAQSGASAA